MFILFQAGFVAWVVSLWYPRVWYLSILASFYLALLLQILGGDVNALTWFTVSVAGFVGSELSLRAYEADRFGGLLEMIEDAQSK